MLSEDTNDVDAYNPFSKNYPEKDMSDIGHAPTETTLSTRKKFNYLTSDISGRRDSFTKREEIKEEIDSEDLGPGDPDLQSPPNGSSSLD